MQEQRWLIKSKVRAFPPISLLLPLFLAYRLPLSCSLRLRGVRHSQDDWNYLWVIAIRRTLPWLDGTVVWFPQLEWRAFAIIRMPTPPSSPDCSGEGKEVAR